MSFWWCSINFSTYDILLDTFVFLQLRAPQLVGYFCMFFMAYLPGVFLADRNNFAKFFRNFFSKSSIRNMYNPFFHFQIRGTLSIFYGIDNLPESRTWNSNLFYRFLRSPLYKIHFCNFIINSSRRIIKFIQKDLTYNDSILYLAGVQLHALCSSDPVL